MTLDEAIEHCKEKVNDSPCGQNHLQLMNWLIELKHLKGEMEKEPYTTTIDLNVDAFIPASYIPNEYQKLDIYKRIASIENEEEMDDMMEELIDRYGDVPRKVQQKRFL